MKIKPTKADYIRIRLTKDQKERIKALASGKKMSLSSYVLDRALYLLESE